MSELTVGLMGESRVAVTEKETAAQWGSGLVPVLGTPTLVGLMESAAVGALSGKLPSGQTTVGVRIDVEHLAPTPVGMVVRSRAELVEIEGRRLVFRIEAWDERELIGRAIHERFVIDTDRFVAKALGKLSEPTLG